MTTIHHTTPRVNHPPAFGTLALRLLEAGYYWTPPKDCNPDDQLRATETACSYCGQTGMSYQQFRKAYGFCAYRWCPWCSHYDELRAL